MHTHTHTHMHTHIRTHIPHMRTHTHTQMHTRTYASLRMMSDKASVFDTASAGILFLAFEFVAPRR